MTPAQLKASLRCILAEVDFYAGVRGAHRTHPVEVSSEEVRAAREELKQMIERELVGGILLQDHAGRGARDLSKWLGGRL